MNVGDFLLLARRRFGWLIAGVVVGVATAVAVGLWVPKKFTAAASAYVVVDVAAGSNANAGVFFSASQLANQKAQAYASVIESNAVADRVRTSLGLSDSAEALSGRISATPVQNSSTIRVSAVADSPAVAQELADRAVEAASEELRTLEGSDSPIRLELLSSAKLAPTSSSPKPAQTWGLCVGGGLVGGLVLAVVLGLADRRIRASEDVSARTTVPVVALVPFAESIGRENGVEVESNFLSEEALRKLRTNLKFASVDEELKVCVISSPNPAEGKSSIAFRLAQVMAAAGEDVVLIDADLRRPALEGSIGVDGSLGLSQVLAGSTTLDRALQKTDQAGLFVLPAGQIPPNPSELLGSQKMAELVTTLSRELFVILDAPPLLPVTDAALLSRVASGVLLIVRAGKTRTDELDVALENVARAGGKTVGIVLNGVPVSKSGRMKYGDQAYSSYYASSSEEQGDEADFDVRAAAGRLSKPAVEQVKSFDAVVGELSVPHRRRPQFRPVSGHAKR